MPRKKPALVVQKPFPFLKLPPEIRNRICRYTVIKDKSITIRLDGRQNFVRNLVPSRLRSGKELQQHREDDERRIHSTPLALAFTCRQLYAEATLIYYSENTFHFQSVWWYLPEDTSMLPNFTAAIGPRNASSIVVAQFQYWMIPCPIFPNLSVLPGLKRLKVEAPLFDDQYLNNIWLPQMSEYAQNHPSVVIEIYGLPEGRSCANAQILWCPKTPGS